MTFRLILPVYVGILARHTARKGKPYRSNFDTALHLVNVANEVGQFHAPTAGVFTISSDCEKPKKKAMVDYKLVDAFAECSGSRSKSEKAGV